MKGPSVRRRIIYDRLFKTGVVLLTICSILPMFFILFFITSKGISVINWGFLTQLPKPAKKKNNQAPVEIDIEKAISEKRNFPFVAGNISLIPRKLSVTAVKEYLLKDKKWKDAVKDRNIRFKE